MDYLSVSTLMIVTSSQVTLKKLRDHKKASLLSLAQWCQEMRTKLKLLEHTELELAVLKQLLLVKTNKQIAKEVNYSVATIANKMYKLLKMYNCKTRYELIAVLVELRERGEI